MREKVLSILRGLIARLRLLSLVVPIRVPTNAAGVEAISSSILSLYEAPDEGFKLIVRRRIAEALLHGANKRTIVLRLQFYLEVQSAMAAGAAFGVLQTVKEEEKAREQQRIANKTV